MKLLEQAAIGIVVLDGGGRIVEGNAHLARLTARTVDELAALGLAGIADPDDWARQQPRIAEIARGERSRLELELRCARPDGTPLRLALSLSAFPDPAGPRVLALVREGSGEEDASKETPAGGERRFEEFMRHLPGLAWIKDLEGRYVFANEAAERAFQRPRAELYGRRDDEIFPARTSAAFRENDAKALRSDTGLETFETLEHADGVRHSLVKKFPIAGADGTHRWIGGIAIDVTARLAAEAALHETEARFRDMADHAPVLIWVNDPEGCEFVNREYLRFLGCAIEEVRGDGWRRFIHPEDAEAYLDEYARSVAEQRPFEALLRFRRADGDYRWLRSTGVPRFHSDGSLKGYVGCSVDISELQRSERALKQADRRKDEFLATLAHELRNPLAPIRSALEILADDAGPRADLYQMLERQVDQLVRLVDDLLDVSRITRGHLALRTERVQLADVLRTALETVRPQLDAARHKLVTSLPRGPLWLDADPLRLAQLLVNLLGNSARYTPEGGRIEIVAERRGEEVVIAVRDNGVGIAPELLPRVFEPFTQIGPAPRDAAGGLGIGLALAAQLAALHRGRLEAHSDGPGRGSEFRVVLPLAEAPAQAARGEAPGRDGRSRLPEPILVVDDNRDGAESLALLLRAHGVRAEVALDGPSALRAVSELRPAAVLLDLGMPEMDGFEVARRLRADPIGRALVLVALTGWNQPEVAERCARAGFDHHVVKPVKLEALERALSAGGGVPRGS
jgi:PAS domain S-box-containing protein